MEKYLESFAKAPPTTRYGGLAAVVALLTAANYFLAISSLGDEITAQESQQRSLDLKRAERQEIANNINERRREMEVLEQRLSMALNELPERPDLDELLAQLNDAGRKSNLEISLVEPGTEAQADGVGRLPIKMAVAGNYHEVVMFLQEVGNLRRIVNVNDISLDTPTMKNEKVLLKGTFVATTFRFLDPSRK